VRNGASAASLPIRIEEDPVFTVQVAGEVDLANVGELVTALERAVTESPRGLVLDLSATTYVDSAGLSAILSAYQRLRSSNGVIVIVITNPVLREIFDIMRMESFPGMRLCTDASTAREYMASRGQGV
jgi:anti-sigma B factor antagonist